VGAAAQNICAPRTDLVKRLWDRWQEAQVSLAMINDGRLLEIFASEAGSWTAIISDPNGRSCVASAGQEWTVFDAPKVPGDGA
jgi:hypothetical protein